MKYFPTFEIEQAAWDRKCIVIGLDEVGRGSLAGPLTVGAVSFKPDWMDSTWKKIEKTGINDSKILSPKKRDSLAEVIKKNAFACATASSTVDEINVLGITSVTCRLFEKVVLKIISQFNKKYRIHVIVDGKISPPIRTIKKDMIATVVDGDAKSISIAAASIIAKVDRDHQMSDLARSFPYYKWELNKGYGTKAHISALQKHGASNLHRKKYITNILHI